MIETQRKIFDLLIRENYSFEDDYIEFLFDNNIENALRELNLSPELLSHSGNKYIRILKDNFPFLLFNDKKEFQKISIVEKAKTLEKDILIFSKEKKEAISFIGNVSYINFEVNNGFYYFTNIFSYVDFVNFLKTLDNSDENAFHFIDYFNKDHKKIVLTSLSEKSRIIIKYKNEIPIFNDEIDLSIQFKEFVKCFDEKNNQLTKFLKNSFIELSSRFDYEDRLPNLFRNLDKILYNARLNFEVYINNLSIDKVKEDYYNFKTKYFKNISDILSKLTQKIISLPIGFATALFIINKLTQNNPSGNAIFLYTLIAILFISMIFIVFLLKIHYKDLLSIYSSFDREYKALMKNNFFIKYPDEIKDFEELKDNLDAKILILKIVTIGYYWLLVLSNLLLFYFVLNKLDLKVNELSLKYLILIILITIILLILGNLLIVRKRKQKESVA